MIKLFLIMILSAQFAFGFFSLKDSSYANISNEVKILKTLDIDTSFLRDSQYNKMKNDIDSLKTKYFLQIL